VLIQLYPKVPLSQGQRLMLSFIYGCFTEVFVFGNLRRRTIAADYKDREAWDGKPATRPRFRYPIALGVK